MTEENRRENAQAEIRKARGALAAADTLIAAGSTTMPCAGCTYAVFHMASAVLLSVDVEVKTHGALQSLLRSTSSGWGW